MDSSHFLNSISISLCQLSKLLKNFENQLSLVKYNYVKIYSWRLHLCESLMDRGAENMWTETHL